MIQDNYNVSNSFSFLEAKGAETRKSPRKGVLTIIQSEKRDKENGKKKSNGVRILFSKQLEQDLQLSEQIQIGITHDKKTLVLGAMLDPSKTFYNLKRVKKDNIKSKLVLYNSAAVKEIIAKMELDFSERVSITFYGVEYFEDEKGIYAKVWREGEV